MQIISVTLGDKVALPAIQRTKYLVANLYYTLANFSETAQLRVLNFVRYGQETLNHL